MNYLSIDKQINDLNYGSYTLEQKRTIIYALYNCNFDLINPIMNSNIPSDYMYMFVNFIRQNIDIAPYVNMVWKTPVEELEQLIKKENEPKIKKNNKGMK